MQSYFADNVVINNVKWHYLSDNLSAVYVRKPDIKCED